jgi:hypothetical protein
MGGKHQTGHLAIEDQKLYSLRPGLREMEINTTRSKKEWKDGRSFHIRYFIFLLKNA